MEAAGSAEPGQLARRTDESSRDGTDGARADPGVPDVRAGAGGTLVAALVPAGVGIVAFAVYLALAWVRFSTGRAGNYDLGIFAQAAQRWAAGRLPGSSIRSLDTLFADHFSPITLLFGAGWRVWPDPHGLLVVQSLALALAAALHAGYAVCRLGPGRLAALVVAPGLALAAAVAKGVISAASFDVHEAALGTPIMAGLCWGLLERRRRLVFGCAAGLLLVKEDLGLTVVTAAAVWWWLTRERQAALALAGLGGLGFAVANAVILVASPTHENPYLQFLLGASGNPQGLAGAQVAGGVRWAPAVLFVLTAGVVGLRSPVAALALPTLAWRAASSNVSYWQTYFHYDVILVPVAAFALVDVLGRVRPEGPDGRRPRWRPVVVAVVAVVAVGWAGGLGIAKIASWRPWDPRRYVLAAPQQDAAALVRQVPRGAPLVAQQDLGPPVLARVDVRMLASTVPARGRWVLLTLHGSELGAPEADKRRWLERQRARPGVRVTARGDVVLVELPGVETVVL